MNTIIIKIDHEKLAAMPERELVAGSVGVVQAAVEFDGSWDGYAKTIVFTGGDARNRVSKAVLVTGEEIPVPWEVLAAAGELEISAVGLGAGIQQPTARMEKGLRILPGGAMSGGEPGEHTPEVWQQALTEMNAGLSQVQTIGNAVQTANGEVQAAKNAAEAAAQQAAESETIARQAGSTAAQSRTLAEEAAVAAEKARDQAVAAAGQAGGGNRVAEVILTAAGWTGDGPYVQEAAVAGMTESWVPGYPVLVPEETMEQDQAAREAWQCVCRIESGAGVLRFVCYTDKPGVDLQLRVPDML